MPDQPSEASATTPGPPSSPQVSVAPGWYSVNQGGNSQSYWDGERWAKTRHWRGTGWVEDGGDPAVVGTGSGDGMGAAAGATPPRVTLSATVAPKACVLSFIRLPADDGRAADDAPTDCADDQRVGDRLTGALGPRALWDRLPARYHFRPPGGAADSSIRRVSGRRRPGAGGNYRRVRLAGPVGARDHGLDRTVRDDPQQCRLGLLCGQPVSRGHPVGRGRVGTLPTRRTARSGTTQAAWTAGTYASNYAPLTSGTVGGPYRTYLRPRPATSLSTTRSATCGLRRPATSSPRCNRTRPSWATTTVASWPSRAEARPLAPVAPPDGP